MMKVRFTEEADADLDEVWLYVAKDNISAADKLIDRLVEAVKPLGDFPEMGAPRDALGTGIRSLRVGAYMIFYRLRTDGVAIERILHGSRDIDADFF